VTDLLDLVEQMASVALVEPDSVTIQRSQEGELQAVKPPTRATAANSCGCTLSESPILQPSSVAPAEASGGDLIAEVRPRG